VVLEGKFAWTDSGWECCGVWSTDIKKKTSEKLGFVSRLQVVPALVRGDVFSPPLLLPPPIRLACAFSRRFTLVV
jgi:hypothetical protein